MCCVGMLSGLWKVNANKTHAVLMGLPVKKRSCNMGLSEHSKTILNDRQDLALFWPRSDTNIS